MKSYLLKFACVTVLMIVGICFSPAFASYASSPRLRVDHRFVEVSVEVSRPIITDEYLFVPLRAVMEAVGFNVEWQPTPAGTAKLTNHDTKVLIVSGSDTMLVNGKIIPLAAPTRVVNGRMMIISCAFYDAFTMLVRRYGFFEIYTGNVPALWSSPRIWPVNSTNWPEHLPQHVPGSIILHPEHAFEGMLELPGAMQFRAVFYGIPQEISRLVSVDAGIEWSENKEFDYWQTMRLMSFVEYFNISREDFDAAMDRLQEVHERFDAQGIRDINDEWSELPNADIIFTFDNDIARYFFRRE